MNHIIHHALDLLVKLVSEIHWIAPHFPCIGIFFVFYFYFSSDWIGSYFVDCKVILNQHFLLVDLLALCLVGEFGKFGKGHGKGKDK